MTPADTLNWKMLSEPQLRHLMELCDIAERGRYGEAHWRPDGSHEWSTARALARRGLLVQDYSRAGRGASFKLTPKGFEVGMEAIAMRDAAPTT